MRSIVYRAGTVLATASVVVLGLEAVSYAANGSLLVAGTANSESYPTSIVNTGTTPAMKFVVKNIAAPPFTTNATGLVANLNAAKLGGYTAMTFLSGIGTTKAFTFTDNVGTHGGSTNFRTTTIPSGMYLVTLNGILTLTTAGSVLTGNVLSKPLVHQGFRCRLNDPSIRFAPLGEYDVDLLNGREVAPSFTVVANISSAVSYQLACSPTSGGWTSIVPLSLTFIKLDSKLVHALPVGP